MPYIRAGSRVVVTPNAPMLVSETEIFKKKADILVHQTNSMGIKLYFYANLQLLVKLMIMKHSLKSTPLGFEATTRI